MTATTLLAGGCETVLRCRPTRQSGSMERATRRGRSSDAGRILSISKKDRVGTKPHPYYDDSAPDEGDSVFKWSSSSGEEPRRNTVYGLCWLDGEKKSRVSSRGNQWSRSETRMKEARLAPTFNYDSTRRRRRGPLVVPLWKVEAGCRANTET